MYIYLYIIKNYKQVSRVFKEFKVLLKQLVGIFMI